MNNIALLEKELTDLEAKMAESDKPENAIKRTSEELAERYSWSDRVHAIRSELRDLYDAREDIYTRDCGETLAEITDPMEHECDSLGVETSREMREAQGWD